MSCARCGHKILPGQLFLLFRRDGMTTRHVSCPTERQVERARLWGRWL